MGWWVVILKDMLCVVADERGLCQFKSGDMKIDETLLREVEAAVREAGITLAPLDGGGGGAAPAGFGGWVGGTVWLVPTDARVEDWKPIATRTL